MYVIPLGALLAAEHAYERIPEETRADGALVAELLLQAAAPFVGPIAAQLGRGRIGEETSHKIFGEYLRGTPISVLADRYAVTPPTIRKHLARRARTALIRHQGGVSVPLMAKEIGCSPATLADELERQARRDGDSSTKAGDVPLSGADQLGAMGRGCLRSSSGRCRQGPERVAAHRG